MNLDLPSIFCAGLTLDQAELLAPRNERNRPVVLRLKPLRELPNCGPFTSRKSLDVEQKEILQWRDPFVTDDFFAETQKST
jgi:hypothetical protein